MGQTYGVSLRDSPSLHETRQFPLGQHQRLNKSVPVIQLSGALNPVSILEHRPDRGGNITQQLFSRRPIDAGIRHRHTVLQFGQFGLQRLVAGSDIAFYHQADYGTITRSNLFCDFPRYHRLPVVILAGIGVTAIDHDVGRETKLNQPGSRRGDTAG